MPKARPRAKRVKRILNVVPSEKTDRDWKLEHADEAGLLAAAPSVPSSKDLRAAWWKVGDQGATGSCVGWATADAVLRWHMVKAGRLKNTEKLSVRFQWMASKETDQFSTPPTTFIEDAGTSVKAALDVARKYGAVREPVLGFEGKLYPGREEAFYALASEFKIGGYFNLTPSGNDDLEGWRRWLATKGPIATRLSVDRTWDKANDTKGNLDVYKRDTARGGHAVSVVGYTADRFIIRNSWGTGWGDKGFAFASIAYARDAFTEAYGVQI